jgi:MFS family permease
LALLIGETVNSIGSWASAIALWGFAAYRFNASPLAVSLLIVCWAAPSALLSPVVGVYVDRVGPRRALVAGYLAAGATAVAMASASSLPMLAIAASLYGATRAVTGPAADALPPRVVGRDQLLTANALLGAAGRSGQLLGPLAASLTLALAGFRVTFLLDAVTYLVGVAAVARLPLLPAVTHSRPGWRHELREGLSVVRREPRMRRILVALAAVTFTSGAVLVVEPLYAHNVLHRPASQFALFEAAAGAGAVLAGLAMPHLRRHLAGDRVVAGSAISFGLAAWLFIGTTSVAVAYLGAFIWGITAAVFSAVSVTALQRLAPIHTHGRVMALRGTLQAAVETLSLPLAGVALAALGIRPGAILLAAVAVTGGLLQLNRQPSK